MNEFIPVNEPVFEGNEKKYLNECIDTGWISFEGPFVKKFEREFSKYIDRKHGISVSNGTAALEVSVKALGIKKGDEVIMPAFTIISCASAIVKAGGVPVLVDSDPFTWNMDIQKIEKKINNKTKALMIVHIYGLPVDIDPVLELARKYNLKVIEDAAEMHGQTYKGKKCGSFGDISIFSFYPNKHITTGEGGMIVTDDDNLADRCQSLRNLCFMPEKRFLHYELGWNYRITNMQAAVGLAQLERMDYIVEKKRKIGNLYNSLLEGVNNIQLPLKKTDYSENIYWVYGIVVKNNVNCNAEEIMIKLKDKNIGSRPFFYPMHKQPVFNNMGLFNNEKYPIAEKIAEKGFYIPSGLALKEEQIHIVAQTIKNIFNNIK